MKLRTAKRIVDEAGAVLPSEAWCQQFMRWAAYDASDRELALVLAYIERRGAHKMLAILVNAHAWRANSRTRTRER